MSDSETHILANSLDLAFGTSLYSIGAECISLLERLHHEAYFVGGFVRDAIIHKPQHDIDITTSAPYEQVCCCFKEADWGVFRTGEKHGTVTVVKRGVPIEITRFRAEGSYSDGRHPDSVSFCKTIEEDLARRDFTINAIAFNPNKGLIDPYGGLADIQSGSLRTVGNPSERFTEDALRILRGLRFASTLGYTINPDTSKALHACKDQLCHVSQERIFSEFTKFLCGKQVYPLLMAYADIVYAVIPELSDSWKFEQRTPWHIYDVYDHITHAVAAIEPTPLLRWVALLHDVGKPAKFTLDENGVGHFKGHAKVSYAYAQEITRRLKMPRALAEDVELLVLRHDDVVEPTPKAVKHMIRKLNGRFDLFYSLCSMKRADTLSQSAAALPRMEIIAELEKIAHEIEDAEDALDLRHLALRGTDLIELGLTPGPGFSKILNAALDAVIDEVVPNEKEALIQYLKEQRML